METLRKMNRIRGPFTASFAKLRFQQTYKLPILSWQSSVTLKDQRIIKHVFNRSKLKNYRSTRFFEKSTIALIYSSLLFLKNYTKKPIKSFPHFLTALKIGCIDG